MKLPATFEPSSVVAVCDTREQRPLDLSPLKSVPGTLDAGDYSLVGFTDSVAIERKSLEDLVQCVGRERSRFDRCIQRLTAYDMRALVVESDWATLEAGTWRGKVTSQQVVNSLLSWQSRGVPLLLTGSHERAGRMVAKLLFLYARRRYRELRALVANVDVEPKPKRSPNAPPRETLASFDPTYSPEQTQ